MLQQLGTFLILLVAAAHFTSSTEVPADRVDPETEPTEQQPRNRTCNGICVIYFQCHENKIVPPMLGKRFVPDDSEPECPYRKYVCCEKRSALEGPRTTTGKPTSDAKCGFRSRKRTFPWMVIVYREELDDPTNQLFYQCGASLIAPNVALTVAHCVLDQPKERLVIRAGEWRLETEHQNRRVAQLITRKASNVHSLANDVALIVLSEPFQLTETIQPICLPPKGTSFDRSDCFTVGWDRIIVCDGYAMLVKRIWGEQAVVPHDVCPHVLPPMRPVQPFLCAGGVITQDMCPRNSTGFPLVCPIPGSPHHYYQAGIVAMPNGCDDNGAPGIFVQVAHYRDWINQQLVQRKIPARDYIYEIANTKLSKPSQSFMSG